jgi:NADH-quinone oxidoreductase subunit L
MRVEPVVLVVALPLLGAFINITAGWKLPRRVVEAVACASVAGSFAFAVTAFYRTQGISSVAVFDWLRFAGFDAPVRLSLDALSGTMAMMITGVSALIHVYSIGYMKDDPGYARFFALLNLFVFSMLMLVLASNLPLLYLGWEGVGFCSYALIGFWYKDPAKADAGRKAFVVTRVGDVSLGLALIWLFYLSGTTDIGGINLFAPSIPGRTATAVGLMLLFGAAGKSAQLPLSTWLPDAMAGPTPVSALIHAATMVTAGVYLMMRLLPVVSVSQTALAVTAIVGGLTAFYAATVALFQRDIKKVLAYSTMSQIGYMFLGVGAGVVAGPLFHLFTHAFFKALLFMGAGCIIHALHEEQDMFKMGGLMYRMPVVFWCFLAGGLALCAAPGTAGFFSKDEILMSVMSHGSTLYTALWALGEFTALITALYVFRAVYLVFMGKLKTEPGKVSWIMVAMLVPLALLSLAGGLINAPVMLGGSMKLSALLGSQGFAVARPERQGWAMTAFAAAVPVAGLVAGYFFYAVVPAFRERLYEKYRLAAQLAFSGWGLDTLYEVVFVRPYGVMSRVLWKGVDEGVIDGGLEGVGTSIARLGTLMRASVTGRASVYITVVVAGGALILAFLAWM